MNVALALRNSIGGALRSPWYFSSVIIARGGTNVATLFWSLGAITQRRGATNAAYGWIYSFVPEGSIAGCLGTLAIIQLVWIVRRLPPQGRWGCLGYGFMGVWWAFMWFSALGPGFDSSFFGSGFVVAALAFFGFMSNPKPENDATR